MISKNKQYQTKSGRPVKIYEVYADDVHGAIQLESGKWIVEDWDTSGEHIEIDEWCLEEVKPKHTIKFYLNVYGNSNQLDFEGYKSLEKADATIKNNRIACLPITLTFEEGEGL